MAEFVPYKKSTDRMGQLIDVMAGGESGFRQCVCYRGLMQWLASKAHNLEVPGSSPGPATNICHRFRADIVQWSGDRCYYLC